MPGMLGDVVGDLVHLARQLIEFIHHGLSGGDGAVRLFGMPADLLHLADHAFERLRDVAQLLHLGLLLLTEQGHQLVEAGGNLAQLVVLVADRQRFGASAGDQVGEGIAQQAQP